MKTRKELFDELNVTMKDGNAPYYMFKFMSLTIELLLDIRGLLQEMSAEGQRAPARVE